MKGVRSKRRRRRRNHHSVDLMERERREKERLGPAEIKGMRRREAERGSATATHWDYEDVIQSAVLRGRGGHSLVPRTNTVQSHR